MHLKGPRPPKRARFHCISEGQTEAIYCRKMRKLSIVEDEWIVVQKIVLSWYMEGLRF